MQAPALQLTRNGILYLSLGFRQDYILQVLTLSHHLNDLQLVLYDGLVYIGAIYRAQCPVQELDVVRVTPLQARPNEPILLHKLEVIRSGLTEVLGGEVVPLDQLMRRREFRGKPPESRLSQDGGERGQGRKIAKLIEEGSSERDATGDSEIKAEQLFRRVGSSLEVIALDESGEQGERGRYEERMVIESSSEAPPEPSNNNAGPIHQHPEQLLPPVTEITQNNVQFEDKERKQDEVRLDLQEKPSSNHQQQRIIRNTPVQSNTASLMPNRQPMIIDADEDQIDLQITCPPPPPPPTTPTDNSLHIRDLYQRMTRFRILCRINHLSYFISSKGTYCTKLHLIDQTGDQITCMLFQKAHPNTPHPRPLVKGKTYIFHDGEVAKDAEGVLSLTVPLNNIIEQHRFMPNFVTNKMLRLGDIQRQQSSDYYMNRAINLQKNLTNKRPYEPINVCGIFQGFKEQPKATKNNFRVTGVLCDPDVQIAIHFSLLVDELQSFPKEGSAISLHRVTVVEDQRTLQLQGAKQSYILDELGNTHEYFADLLKSSGKGDWRYHEYRNLSMITYTGRNIGELQNLLSRVTTSELAFSQIDCTISTMRERRSYEACLICKREVKTGSHFSYCFNCKKHNKHSPRFMFDLELSDHTGCIRADLSSDILEQLIGITAEQYAMTGGEEERRFSLDLWAYSGVVVRVKSQRVVGGVTHKVVSASKTNHKRSLSQIRNMAIEEKTKYLDAWAQ